MSSHLQTTSNLWPTLILRQPWPADGISYIYEHRGYVRPEKLQYWLRQAFAPGTAKSIVHNQRIYVKAPRRPTEEEYEWFGDKDPRSSVFVKEVGGSLRLPLN